MAAGKALEEYKDMVANFLRDLEERQAGGDRQRLQALEDTPDDELMRRWLWKGSIVGALAFFVGLPLVFYLIGMIVPYVIMQFFWMLLKLGMGMVVIMFCLAIFFTVRRSGE